jgi:hypothetical protein
MRIIYRLNNDAASPTFLGEVLSGTDTLAPVTLEGSVGTTTGRTTARVDHGALGLDAFALGQVLVVSELDFEDTLVVTSTSLPFGSPVDLRLTLDVDYSRSDGCTDVSSASIAAYLTVGAAALQ